LEIGIIAPIKLLEECCVTNTQYCIPELLLNSKTYLSFYKKKESKGDKILLDCKKLTWKRIPESLDIILQALKLITPTYIILPSYMFNKEKTIEVQKEYKKRLKGYKLIYCLEGTNEKETLDYLKLNPKVRITIPSHNINTCKNINWGYPVIYLDTHLRIDEIQPNDTNLLLTSLPVRLGLQGRLLSDFKPSPPSLTFYEEENNYPAILNKNIEEVIRYYQ
jgi:mRNA-degrading endonuclease RelE of RelBE toxin-antitoxin system